MIAWFTKNHVAANLLLLSIVFLGLFTLSNRLILEVFPSFELDTISIRTTYNGATPSEIEESVTVRIEEEIADIQGIKEILSRSAEGSSSITVRIEDGYDDQELLTKLKTQIDSITSLPDEAERPVVSKPEIMREVITLIVYGDLSERELLQTSETIRDDLTRLPEINQVELGATRDYEINIEIPQHRLQEYGLTLSDVSNAIRSSSLNLSAGNIKTSGGEILLRTQGQAYQQSDFENITLSSNTDGSTLKIKDIANVIDGFADDDLIVRYNGKPAMWIEVFRSGDGNAIKIAAAVRDYIDDKIPTIADEVGIQIWDDNSKVVKNRLNTLINSAVQGGLLVILILALFLRPAVAVWVSLGIPISFMGGLIMMPIAGVTINVISLFAFILVLGIVVDDAIVTGENVYRHLRRGESGLNAAIIGTQEVSVPVTFGVLTTIVAFIPLLFIEGARGQIFYQIPAIVIPVLIFSLIESKFILPAHLKNIKPPKDKDQMFFLSRFQQNFSHGFENMIIKYYKPALDVCLRNKSISLITVIGFTVVIFTLVSAGWVRFIFFPRIESEEVRISLTMPTSTPFVTTESYINNIEEITRTVQEKYTDPDTNKSVIKHILTNVGYSRDGSGPNYGMVNFEVEPPEDRKPNVKVKTLVDEIRTAIGDIPGAESLNFRAELGRGDDPISVQLSGVDLDQMSAFANKVKDFLQQYNGVFDIKDSLSDGKTELEISLKDGSEQLGITRSMLAVQIRQAFFGIEAQEYLRGRNEVTVRVRYPEDERQSLSDLNQLYIQTDDNRQIAFSDVASIKSQLSPQTIYRVDRRRTLDIVADIDKQVVRMPQLQSELNDFLLANINQYPGVDFSFEGEAKEQRETFGSLKWGLLFALFLIYSLLAIPFKSYLQPLIVMSVIPIGLVGAILGHIIMSMPLTIMSIFGMLALLGVVVNDSLVLVDYINQRRREGASVLNAILVAGVDRFRPVILTSITTFAGLTPLLLEKSTQAQFLKPLAVSLGFGILFATTITLFVIPMNYLLAFKAKHALIRLFNKEHKATHL